MYTMPRSAARAARIAIFLAWLGIVCVLASQHVPWRDEVRALILARQGHTIVDMWHGLKGEGHPGLWYLLLRVPYNVFGSRLVLPAVALLIAMASAALLAFASPFRLSLVALIMIGDLLVYEYSVMARNYGISMLLMFLIAIAYTRWRDGGWLLGLLLFLLTSTNVHSVFLAGAFLLFWGGQLLLRDGARWTPALRAYLAAVVITGAGALLCFVTVYPTVNDAAVLQDSGGVHLHTLIRAIFNPAYSFGELMINRPFAFIGVAKHGWLFYTAPLRWTMSLLMFLALLQFVRTPPAFIAALAALLLFSLLFTFVYYGSYRHEGLWLVFVIALRWIEMQQGVFDRNRAEGANSWPWLVQRVGTVAFVALLSLQGLASLPHLGALFRPTPPQSKAYALARAIQARPALRGAIIMADPDWFTETLHYYLPNRTYLVREHRFGDLAIFTRRAQRDLSLSDMLAMARRLSAAEHQPIIIMLSMQLDPTRQEQSLTEGYGDDFRTTAAQTAEFLRASCPLGRFRPAESDEAYDAYVVSATGDPAPFCRMPAAA
jgi:hypothetical protein